jgi:hypothetical protein
MSRTTLLALLLACGALAAGPAPATRPTTGPSAAGTSPTTAPARVRDALLKGMVRFLVPADWTLVGRSGDGLNAYYRLPADKGLVSMVVTPQQAPFPPVTPAIRQKMSASVLAAVTADLKKRNAEVLEPPKLERDDAFVARVVYRFKDEGHVLRAMHAYRGAGFNVVGVTASVPGEDAAEAKAIHDTAATMLLSVTSGPADPKLMRPVKAE